MTNLVTNSPIRQNQPVPQQGPALGASNVAKRAFLCLGTCLKSSCALVSRKLQKGKDKYSFVLDRLKYGQENAHLIAQLNQSGIELSKENKIRFCYHSTPAFLIEPLRQLHAANLLSPVNLAVILNHTNISCLSEAVDHLLTLNILNERHFDVVKTHSSPQEFAHLLSWLHNRNFLTDSIFTSACHQTILPELLATIEQMRQEHVVFTQEMVGYLLNSQMPARLGSGLIFLSNHGLLAQEFIEPLTVHENPQNLAEAFQYLRSSSLEENLQNIYSEQNQAFIRNHSNPLALARALRTLIIYNIDTPDFRQILLNHEHPENLATAAAYLNDFNLLSADNLSRILNAPHQLNILEFLIHNFPNVDQTFLDHLLETPLLTSDQFQKGFVDLIPGCLDQADVMTRIYEICNQSNPLEQIKSYRNQLLGLDNPEDTAAISNHEKPYELIHAFMLLKQRQLYTAENKLYLSNHRDPEQLAQVFIFLNDTHLLTQENKTRVSTYPYLKNLSFIQRLLGNQRFPNGILNQLLERPLLGSPDAFQAFFNRIPSHMVTHAVISRLYELSSQDNPLTRIAAYRDYLLGIHQPPMQQAVLNNQQSTHTASVHASVSESATILLERFRDRLGGLQGYISTLSQAVSVSENNKKEVALRSIDRLTHPEYQFEDPTSHVTTKQLLGFYHLTQAPIDVFIQALYEAQREYNLDQNENDLGDDDRPACAAGCFNKLMQGLQIAGVSGVSITFITRATSALQLKACIKNYCRSHNISDIDDRWDDIKQHLISEMREYAQAFSSAEEFDQFLDTGQFVDLLAP